jgi:ubiquinone/menaquinone biosynthesis C-methylase UbiE
VNSSEAVTEARASDLLRDDLACPRCAGAVSDRGSELACVACGASYPVRDGIADFRCHRYDYYFNPLPRQEMEDLTRAAQSQPWQDTIHRFLKGVKQNPEWFDDLVVDGRYAWKLLLRLPENATVLDLGCGLGNLVKNVAPNVGRVVALDLTIERLRFARERFQRFNASDRITLLAGGDGAYLPFPDGSFDCVTLSGVLEWVAADGDWSRGDTRAKRAAGAFLSFFGSSNPRATQKRFLKEIGRILKPGGQVFIAIENRLSYCYFGGRPDHHSALWFGSLLPRFFANLYAMVARRSPYRTYTYSMNGLRRLLGSAGFASTEFYGLTPGYTELAELLPLQTENQLWQPPAARGRDRIKRNRHFVPAYGVIASRHPTQRPSLAEILETELRSQLNVNGGAIRFRRFSVTDKNKGIIDVEADGRSLVVKVPFNDAIAARAARNYRFLEQAREGAALSKLIPQPVARGEIRGIQYYAEERVAGQPLGTVLQSHNVATWLDAADSFLKALNPCLHERVPAPLSGESYHQQVLEPLERVGRIIDTSLSGRLRRFFDSRLQGRNLRTGSVHGDFCDSNIFVRGTSVVGVIDWDDSSTTAIPAVDAINLVHSVDRLLNRRSSTAESVLRLSNFTRLADGERSFLQTNYERCGVDSSDHLALVLLYWLRHVADQLDGDLVYNRPAIDRRVTSVFEKVLATTDESGA